MSARKRTLRLQSWANVDLRGEGGSVTLIALGERVTRGGKLEQYEIEIQIGRGHVQRIARQIANMHERDRKRLAQETRRIELEVAAITQPENQT